MPYFSGGVMKRGSLVTFKASAAETASTTHTDVEARDASTVTVTVDVTAVSGTVPTMTVVVEGSTDRSTWFTLGTIGANGYLSGVTGTAPTNLTAAATVRGVFAAPQFVRTRSVIAGTTPSFTYSVTGELA